MALFQRIKPALVGNQPEQQTPISPGLRSAGDVLRQQREVFGLDLSQVAAALKIKPAYLAAIEEGRLDLLPGPAYSVGFVRAYSTFLGLDSAEILRRFKLETSGFDAKPDLTFPVPLGEQSMPGGGMLLVALILAVCGYGAWYYWSTAERVHPERVTEVPASLLPAESRPLKSPVAAPAPAVTAPPATTPAAAEAPQNPDISPAAVSPSSVPSVSASAPSPTPVAAAPPPPVAPAPPPSPVSAPNPTEALAAPPPSADGQSPRVYGVDDGPSRVVLRATADSWIQIRGDDHAVLFTGLLKPGDTYRVPDRPGLQLRAGNVGGLDVIVDGKPAPSLGPLGAVRNVTLDPQSLMAEGAGRQ